MKRLQRFVKRVGKWLGVTATLVVFTPMMIVMGMLMYGILKELTLWLGTRLTFL